MNMYVFTRTSLYILHEYDKEIDFLTHCHVVISLTKNHHHYHMGITTPNISTVNLNTGFHGYDPEVFVLPCRPYKLLPKAWPLRSSLAEATLGVNAAIIARTSL